ncbi:gamma-aminobutyric acid type B receptor subunit 2 [Diabrotica virgifera virgifera]|uniref:G-protein coupled receptors family 3 profile domain-containing protein n=1 Tax=Diabrotica virgifera virgifera TaxID=50390 RepID=A0ABM5JGT6_DIAVI|nr:gamma-aminobutyric acid type B receptor subunit 2 [Diabrotica virgifera virgifera]
MDWYLESGTNESYITTNDNDTQKLYILGLFELSTKWGKRLEGSHEMLGAQLAVKHINSLNMLGNYKLELLVNDTMCDPGVGMDRLFHALYSKHAIFMVLGSRCSNVTEKLAHIVSYWNIIQISFGSTSPSLSDRNKFPLFFRTATTDSSHNTAKVQFVKEFGWKVVATFTENENAFLLPVNHLIADLERADVQCIASLTFSLDNYREQLEVLKNLNVRIIFGSFSAEMNHKIICAKDPEFLKEIEMLRRFKSPFPRLTYDAVTAIFHALEGLEINDWFEVKDGLYYLKKAVVKQLVQNMNSLTFVGLSGAVRLSGGERIANSMIRQFQVYYFLGGALKIVAIFDSIKNQLNFSCDQCRKMIWKNNEVPLARRTLRVSKIKIPNVVFIAIILFSVFGIAASISFLYFNLRFKRKKFVKLSSPNLTNITVLGCILVYLSVVVLGFNNSSTYLSRYFDTFCSVRVFLLSTGFSLTFGSIMAKTYRVHRLFTFLESGLLRDKLLKDKQLIALIFVPIIFDGFILTLWLTIDPLRRDVYNLTKEISFGEKGVDYQPQVEMCNSHNITGWYMALLGYKTMFILMGTYMAWKTRHIKIPILNDSQYIGICIYITVFSTIIVIVSSFVSNQNIILTYIIQSVSILTATTVIMFLMFLPIIKSVFGKLDNTDPIMQSMGLTSVSNTRRFIFNDSKEVLNRLEIQNKVHRCRLMKLDSEILYLENVLRSSDKL